MSEFDSKNVIVTGAAGVLGRAVADRFHNHGAKVFGVDVIGFEAPFETHKADLTSFEDAKRVVNEIGSVDVLMNIAGGFTMGDSVADTSDDTWNFMFDLNARTAFNMVRAVVPHMKNQGTRQNREHWRTKRFTRCWDDGCLFSIQKRCHSTHRKHG